MIAMEGILGGCSAVRFWRTGAVVSLLAALALAAFLLARRAIGEITLPLATTALVPTATFLTAWAWLVRLAFEDCQAVRVGRFTAQAAVLCVWLPASVVFAFAVSLSFPEGRFIDGLVWLAAFAAIVFGPSRVLRAASFARVPPASETIEVRLQDLKRYRAADGRESVRGTLATELIPAQRTATLYASFCPPFEHLPQVHAHAVGNGASVKVAQVLHNGVQLELRLAREAKANQVVTVELSATELKAAS